MISNSDGVKEENHLTKFHGMAGLPLRAVNAVAHAAHKVHDANRRDAVYRFKIDNNSRAGFQAIGGDSGLVEAL